MKGARADVDCAVLRAITAAAMAPPILLLNRARLVEVLVKVKINWPLLLKFFSCSNPLVCYRFFRNYAHLVYGMQMASAARAWMYRQPQEDWENFLNGVNGFLNQAEADMRNCGV
jgi:hypothetical protein